MRKEGKLAVCAAFAALCQSAVSQQGLYASILVAQNPIDSVVPEIDNVRGKVMKLDGANLLVGMEDGGVVAFDGLTGKRRFNVPGDGTAPVEDVILYGGSPWWVQEGTQRVKTKVPGISMPMEIGFEGSGLIGPIRRLSVWQQMIMVHADNGIRFIEPSTKMILSPEEVLPSDVAQQISGAVVTSTWRDGRGMLLAIKRFGAKKNPQPGEVADLGMLTAWKAEWMSPYKLLGTYTCDIVNFDSHLIPGLPASGPSTNLSSVNTADLGNILVGDEGIVALDFDEALTIPFANDNWHANRVRPGIAPRYSQISSYYNADVWWADGRRLMHASLEDGTTDVFVPRFTAEIRSLVADEDGVWILTDNGVKRLSPDAEEGPEQGFLRYDLTPDSALPSLGGQSRLSFVLKLHQKPGKRRLDAKNSVEFVKEALKSAGIDKGRVEKIHGPNTNLEELQYGDVVVQSGQAAFYVGNGQVARWDGKALLTENLELAQTARTYRFFASGFKLPNGMSAMPVGDIGPVFPIGVAKPNPRLGHGIYVRVNSDSPYDGPHMPVHEEMLNIIEDWQGTPYVWGGSSRRGTDCSGFVQSVFRDLGVELPRHSQTMARAPFGEVVFDELRFGDVLVYPYPKHVAIYIGEGRTAETVKGGVGYSNVWRRNRAYVRRFLFDGSGGGRWVNVESGSVER